MSPATRACLLLFPLAYAFLALAFGQDANWDLRNYHWYNAYAFLNGRYGFDLLPSQTPYFYNPLLDLPLYWLGINASAMQTTFALGLLQGLNFILLFTLARRVLKPFAGRDTWALLIAAVGMLGGGALGELGTSFYDNVVSLGVLGTLSVLVLRLGQAEDGKRVRWWKWILAGIPIGLVSGLKLPTTVFAVGIGLAFFLYQAPSLRERFTRAALLAGGMLFGFALGLGPWAVFLQSEFANPLFPYFNDLFLSPLAPAESARDMKFLPEGWERLYFPFLFTHDPLQVGEVLWRDLKIVLVYALLPLALVLRYAQPGAPATDGLATPRARFVLLASVLSYVAWLQMFAIYRYAIPLEMLAALLLFLCLDLLRLGAHGKKLVYLGLVMVCIGATVPADWGRKPHGEKFVMTKGIWLPPNRNNMVLMAGFQPYSHVVPDFPASAPFIRIQSNFASPDEPKGINQIIRARVDHHVGPLWLLVPTYDTPWVSGTVLPKFGLKAKIRECRVISNNLSEDLHLCPLVRI